MFGGRFVKRFILILIIISGLCLFNILIIAGNINAGMSSASGVDDMTGAINNMKISGLFERLTETIPEDDILYQDDFEDGNVDISDPNLRNGFSWISEGNLTVDSVYTWPDKAVRMNAGAYILSTQPVDHLEYTVSFSAINWYNTASRVKIAYQDENNYYSFDPTRGIVWRCLDGIEEKLTDSNVERLIKSPRQNPSSNNYKFYYRHNGNSITIAVDRDGYDNKKDYEFTFTDENEIAVDRLKGGNILLARVDDGTSRYWVNFDNIIVSKGKLLASPLREKTLIYVSSTGDDNSPGTEDEPLQTITKAISLSIPGDEIIVENGVYDEEISFKPDRVYGEEGKRLVIRSINKHQAEINSADLKYGDFVTIDGFEVTGSSLNINGSRGVEILNNYIHDLGNNAGIHANGIDGLVAGNYIYKTNKGINVSGRNMLVENNEIERLIYVNQDADYFRFFGEGHIIRGNYMHGTRSDEIGPSHTDGFQTFDNNGTFANNIIIEGNFIEDFYAQGFMGEGGYYYQSSDITFRNNIFKDAGAWGLSIYSIKDVKIYNNLFINMNIHGIGFRGSEGQPATGEVRNNIFYNGGTLYWGIDRDLHASNNLIYNSDIYVNYKQEDFPNDIVNRDPLFVNPMNYDFNIHPSSPAVDAGMVIESNQHDYAGNHRPYNGNWDIGPYEFQGVDHPVAYIKYSNVVNDNTGYEPFKNYFDGSISYVPSGRNIVSYEWDFGDGITKSGVRVDHTFSAGEKTVRLTVTDDNGNSHSTERVFNVLAAEYPNLYLHLPLDGDYQDRSGKEMETSWSGTPLYEDVLNGQVARFNQEESRAIVVEHSDYLDGLEEITIAFWAKKDQERESATLFHKHIIYQINLTEDGLNGKFYSTSGPSLSYSTGSIASDTDWHHYTVTYDGSHVVVYLDGIECFREEYNGRIRRDSSRDLVIGRNPWGDSFSGMMDDIRIYDRALSGEEIRDIAFSSMPAHLAPGIFKQPESQINSVGRQVVFTVGASAFPEPTYQWYHNDEVIEDATSNNLVLENIQENDEGEYKVVISNSQGTVTSNTATLEVIESLPLIENLECIIEYYTAYLTWHNPANQGEDWDGLLVIRNKDREPTDPDDGIVVYDESCDLLIDKNLERANYQYAVYTYKDFNNTRVYSDPARVEVSIPNMFNKEYLKIDSSQQKLYIGQNTRGDLYSLWNIEKITIGKGPGGNETDLWVYSDLIGNSPGQIPENSEIVSARLVFEVEDYFYESSNSGDNTDRNNSSDINKSHRVNIYKITDPENLGSPHYASESGMRVGLDFNYRDHRPGVNIPWMDQEVDSNQNARDTSGNIFNLIESDDPLDTIEFYPDILVDELLDTVQFDITKAVQAWADGEVNQGLYITTDQAWKDREHLELSGFQNNNPSSIYGQPYLEIIYGASGDDLAGPENVEGLKLKPGMNSITLEWTNPADPDIEGIKILRREGIEPFGEHDGELVTIITGNTSTIPESYTDSGLDRGKTYYYAIYTFDSEFNYSEKVWIKGTPGALATVPSLDVPVIGAGRVSLNWIQVGGADSYRIYRKDSSGDIELFEEIGQEESLSYIDHVTAGEYNYWLTAVNQYGEGPLSEEVTVVVSEGAATVPNTPSELSAQSISGSEIELNWLDNSDNELYFVIERQNDNGEWHEVAITAYSTTRYIEKNLQPETNYTYRIKGENEAGSSGYSTEVSVTTLDLPVVVTDLHWEVISSSQIKVKWEDTPNEDSYILELFELTEDGEIGDGDVLDTQILSTDITYCYFVKLEPGKEYRVRVTTVKGENTAEAYSDIIRTSADSKGGLF